MFTGIITEVGSVARADHDAEGLELTIRSSYSDLELGESIAVDGACLTVQKLSDSTFQAHVIRTSLDRTRFADYVPGQRVNLERALRLGDRLGGHLVQGHVDGLGRVEMVAEREDARLLNIRVPPSIGRTSVPQGSITVDGVSLTVNAKLEPDLIQISLIPYTLQHTTLGERRVGDRVHLEADTIGKYVEALWENRVNGQR
ncbi:MAG TPA: riboflavin synthase [Gemmatimonadales bacterium]|jgi:riboflavin synthase